MDQQTRRRRDRRSQLASVAAELFRARGYSGVGINDIAAAAGVTGPALYRHFTDKQSILAYVLLSGLDELERRTAEAASALDAGRLGVLLNELATVAVERRDVTALWRWEGRHLSPEDQRKIAKRSSGLLSLWAKMLLSLRPELGHGDAELLCWAALSVFGSVSVHRTSVARQRYVALLVILARQVLHADLPATEAVPSTTPPPGVGTPSRREQLLSSAAELFHQRGFHAVSMEDIGAAAGIAGPSVYKHFPSKSGLFCAIARRVAGRLALDAERALRRSANETEALQRLTESYVRVLTGSPELLVSLSVPGANIPEQDRADLIRAQRDYVARWVDLLMAARPGLPGREATITVHAALTIANDFTRTRRLAARPRLAAELVALMTAVLREPRA